MQSSLTLKVITCTAECCLLISAQHSTQSSPWTWLDYLKLWAWAPRSATWYWTFFTNRTWIVQIGDHNSSNTKYRSPPGLCAQLPPFHSLQPLLQQQSNNQSSYREQINNLAKWWTTTTYCSMSPKPRTWLLVFEKYREPSHLETSQTSIGMWTVQDRKALQQFIKIAKNITSTNLSSIRDIG